MDPHRSRIVIELSIQIYRELPGLEKRSLSSCMLLRGREGGGGGFRSGRRALPGIGLRTISPLSTTFSSPKSIHSSGVRGSKDSSSKHSRGRKEGKCQDPGLGLEEAVALGTSLLGSSPSSSIKLAIWCLPYSRLRLSISTLRGVCPLSTWNGTYGSYVVISNGIITRILSLLFTCTFGSQARFA